VYRPAHFAEDRPDVVDALLRDAAFGHLVVAGDSGLDAVPLPFLVDRDGDSLVVRTHVAKANRIWRAAPCDALLIVPVTDAYVSPSWYPSKAADGRAVPTWNYEVVHLHGRITAHQEPDWLRGLVTDLTDRHESGRPDRWSVDDPPDGYVDGLLRAIVGIGLEVARVEAKRKLSQNRGADDQLGVVAGLDAEGTARAAAVAEAMRRPLA
jgi:transcriptional regulator